MSRREVSAARLAGTYSIVAVDLASGCMGVAVQSHWFAVGRLVCWAEPGCGVVATQAMVEPGYGPKGLERMRQGQGACQVLAELVQQDEGRALRQVAIADVHGLAAAHTGERCIAFAGHETGEAFSIQANMMSSPDVWPAMAEDFRGSRGTLDQRLMTALEAGERAGGDARGRQSAAMVVVKTTAGARPWEDVLVDLRVEDHPEPLAEMRRLLRLNAAYGHMNRGDAMLGAGQVSEALTAYRTAAEMAPEIAELPFWHAVTLADLGRLEEALPVFRRAFAQQSGLRALLCRLPAAGLLRDDRSMLERILAQDAGVAQRAAAEGDPLTNSEFGVNDHGG